MPVHLESFISMSLAQETATLAIPLGRLESACYTKGDTFEKVNSEIFLQNKTDFLSYNFSASRKYRICSLSAVTALTLFSNVDSSGMRCRDWSAFGLSVMFHLC